MKNSRNKIYAVDTIMSFISVFGVVMFFPMLLHLQTYFGVSVSQISWLPNLGYLTMILFSTIVGKVINKTGIKNLALISLIMWVLGIVIELTALGTRSFYIFVIGRFIEGIGEAFIFPTLLSINKAEIKEAKEEKVGLSLIEFGASVGGLTAAIISGKFVNNPEQFLMIPISIAVLTIAFMAIRIHKISVIEEQEVSADETIKESMPAYISLLFMIFMVQVVFASTQVYLAYYMEAFNTSSLTGGVISVEQILIGLGTLAPVFMLKKMSFKGIRNLIVAVFTVAAAALAMQISIYVSIFAAALVAFSVGYGFTILNVYILKVIKTKISQKISIYSSIRNSGGFVLSFVWGKLIEGYRNSGESYAAIFKHLYFYEGIAVVVIFLIIAFLQREEASFGKMKARQKNLLKEV